MTILPKLKRHQMNQNAKVTRNVVVDSYHAAAPIAAALLKQHHAISAEDRGRLRVMLLRDHDTGGMASWNLNEASTSDVDSIVNAIAADVVTDAVKSGPGHYEAVVAAKTILQSVPFIVPYEIVEEMPERHASNVPESA